MKIIAKILALIFGLAVALVLSVFVIQIPFGMLEEPEIPVVIEGSAEYYDAIGYITGYYTGPIILLVISVVLFAFFSSLAHRLSKKKKDTLHTSDINDPFVLYLRSFKDDRTTRKTTSLVSDLKTEEETLVDVLSDIAPVYAIGDPTDKKMPLGASRVYVDDSHWKSTVTELMKRAVVVVLRLGETDSFWWEVETALKTIPVDRLLFIIPQNKTFDNVAILYNILLEHNIDIKKLKISVAKKSRGSISSFLYFDKDGNAIAKEVKIPRLSRIILSYEKIMRNNLIGFMQKFGLGKHFKTSIVLGRIVLALFIVCALFYCVINISSKTSYLEQIMIR